MILRLNRNALVALYHATDGPNWSRNANWMGDFSLGEWRGVATDDSGRVDSVEPLGSRAWSARFRRNMGDLTRLESLYLCRNNLVGQIPPELGNLRPS